MDLSRRAFLSAAVAAAIGATLDPERLLWVPGRKTIFLPSVAQQRFLFTIGDLVYYVGGVRPTTLNPLEHAGAVYLQGGNWRKVTARHEGMRIGICSGESASGDVIVQVVGSRPVIKVLTPA